MKQTPQNKNSPVTQSSVFGGQSHVVVVDDVQIIMYNNCEVILTKFSSKIG